MSNEHDTDVTYKSKRDILCYHGFIIYFLYLASRLSEITPTRLWFLLGEKLKGCCVNNTTNKTKAWWQDLGVLIHALTTVVISTILSYKIFAWILIVDIISYHMRVLWFDDLIPKQSRNDRKVLSHRRVLFQGFINFVESIFLFGVLYFTYCGSSYCKPQIYQASFEVATTLSHPELLSSCPAWLINTQIGVSIFFLVVVISIVASVGYKREELAP